MVAVTRSRNRRRSVSLEVSSSYMPSQRVRVRHPVQPRSERVSVRRPLSFTTRTYRRGEP